MGSPNNLKNPFFHHKEPFVQWIFKGSACSIDASKVPLFLIMILLIIFLKRYAKINKYNFEIAQFLDCLNGALYHGNVHYIWTKVKKNQMKVL